MDTDVEFGRQWILRCLLAILVIALAMRLYHFQSQVLDQHHGKQIFIANKARNIASSMPRALWPASTSSMRGRRCG